MLPVEFLPDVDELPVSWMNRLALANGFIDVNDMLRSYRIIDGSVFIENQSTGRNNSICYFY